ncbi:MAG TPA: LysE family transporter [Thermoclostridium caenicola]|uniref:Threonine/homoserine/homoserine lactone efflux protein n=1 Tax=Thermoclostridium caenicola TaxID=659425 RepID=A0A1M6B669_9FIRM|nr:LysE family transporter [Thermoclostridium caenicola]SHI44231.1 Threonine/homoserine/homoserine lactone efflux protein [Thermoclostridium caenicola]HOK43742.1 LysE family transporter [Thermoclostridium caenicola]HOL84756.1 LysE family transporter [Thermoclostridium caenicola]HOP72768.1 LysE family transporter [Thermoclostridium caenicola]HPO76866.1 LysE family transporter [Thermoclostridium caenicola]
MYTFIRSFIIGFSGAMMPGSLLTYTVEKSLKIGPKAGPLVSLGHALLELVLVILLFIGVGQYLETPLAQMIIGFLGGAVLIFFGGSMIRDAAKGKLQIDMKSASAAKSGGIILGSMLVSASNPYFAVWWAAVGLGLMMEAYNLMGVAGVVLFYTGHILSDFSWYTLVSFIIGKTRKFINMKIYRIIIVVLGAVLIAFGAGFLVSSVKMLLGPVS